MKTKVDTGPYKANSSKIFKIALPILRIVELKMGFYQ